MTIDEARMRIVTSIGTIYEDDEAKNIAELIMEYVTNLPLIERIVKKNETLTPKQEEVLEQARDDLERVERIGKTTNKSSFMTLGEKQPKLFSEENLGEVFVRASDDVAGDEFADLARGLRTGVHGGFHTGHVTFADDRDETAADGDGFGDADVGGFRHGIGGFDAASVAFGFDHADCFVH